MNPLSLLLVACLLAPAQIAKAWGFFAHERINRLAVFSLPPEMMVFFKPHIEYITQQATAPDKRRYMLAAEGARHYLDADHYGQPLFAAIPRSWSDALVKFTADTLQRYGILPWHLEKMMAQLTAAFQAGDGTRILRLASELGHYMGDAHVPLHACSNHNGQLTGQHGIHGLWESRIPELLGDEGFDYWTGRAGYIKNMRSFIWQVVTESALAADTVLRLEKKLSLRFPADQRYAYELRKGVLVRNYSAAYTKAYQHVLGDMVERRMRGSVAAIAACWYTAWVDAGQPPLNLLTIIQPDKLAIQRLDSLWRHGKIFDREH
ncbi:S1/P1 Nuclease [Chitinophaga sp. SYP-B3965]|uniref:zinc dependent phospholipase C family protein n=1 Tax=Chitinophaga sp. SYP-B3965 TaxID=2663120 RepID=UPI0012996FB2|nr:zinc dependent phospholipase C family protein [Chitinophaga sp. SYP-B3965]MRG48665.1 S1/P1 Nuclease [Chitinophaga sp. SYP-B3965]